MEKQDGIQQNVIAGTVQILNPQFILKVLNISPNNSVSYLLIKHL